MIADIASHSRETSVAPGAVALAKPERGRRPRQWRAAWCAVLGAGLWLTLVPVHSQTPAGLDLQVYAGLTVTGAVGTVYSIEFAAPLSEPPAWRAAEFLQLPTTAHFWADSSAPIAAGRFYRATVLTHLTNLVFIAPGTFRLGSPADEVDRWDDEGPQTVVTLRRGYWFGKYEITQREYQALIGSNPSQFTGNTGRPVERVTWAEATNYCFRLTTQERAAGHIPTNAVFRLPTEAEWEYACRALTSTRFSYGEDPGYTNLAAYAWYGDNSFGVTHPVGQKQPNPWGIYDLHGNVYEWCQDWYGAYPGGKVIDPRGPATGQYRVARGGEWYLGAKFGRSAYRNYFSPQNRDNRFGFRLVLALEDP